MPIIDMHAHWGRWQVDFMDYSVDSLRAVLDRCDICAMIFSSAKSILYDITEGNRDIFDFVEQDDRFYGYVTVNPNLPERSLEEIRRYSDHPKFKGVKFHPVYTGSVIDDPRMDPIYAYAEKIGCPVLIHAMGNTTCSPLRLVPVNRKFPALKLIGAHTGGAFPELACQAAAQTNENVFFDLSCSCILKNRVENIVRAAGADRVLFGSDYSLIEPAFVIGEVEEAALTGEERRKIYYSNSAKLFGLE